MIWVAVRLKIQGIHRQKSDGDCSGYRGGDYYNRCDQSPGVEQSPQKNKQNTLKDDTCEKSKFTIEQIQGKKWKKIYTDRHNRSYQLSSEQDYLKIERGKSPVLVYECVRGLKETVYIYAHKKYWSYKGSSEWEVDDRTNDKYRLKISYWIESESSTSLKSEIYIISKIYKEKRRPENLYYKECKRNKERVF